MATRVTHALAAQLRALGNSAENFAAEFNNWKAGGERTEYGSYLFGKDGAYTRPKVNGQNDVLRHVHLVPLNDPNPETLNIWNRNWQLKRRKTSKRALVYVSDAQYGHLLLFILGDDPDAHDIAKMATEQHRQLMLRFAAVADRFIHTGEVLG